MNSRKSANSESQKLGSEGEEHAVRFLLRSGYQILSRNWRAGRYEIDIVAFKAGEVVFVEVKTRKADCLPELAVDSTKQKHIAIASRKWLSENSGDFEVRFDIIAISGSELVHLQDAFFPGF